MSGWAGVSFAQRRRFWIWDGTRCAGGAKWMQVSPENTPTPHERNCPASLVSPSIRVLCAASRSFSSYGFRVSIRSYAFPAFFTSRISL